MSLIIIGGRKLPPVAPRASEPPPALAQRPGCLPSCCGATHALDGGHHAGDYASGPCLFRPRRVFDHLEDGVDDQLVLVAHEMRRSSWWYAWVGRAEQRYTLDPIAGELP